jgi:hypothetical protein
MFILLLLGLLLLTLGRRVARKALYPTSTIGSARLALLTFRHWEQERTVEFIGGIALQFSGVVVILGALTQ